MKYIIIPFVFTLFFASNSIFSQNISPFVQESAFKAYLNPADISLIDQIENLSFTVGHRRSFKPSKSFSYTFAGAKYHIPINRDSFKFYASGFTTSSQTEAVKFSSFQAGLNITFKHKKFQAGIGLSLGSGHWKIEPQKLHPWDLGDPLLPLNDFPETASKLHLSTGLFFKYKPTKKKPGFFVTTSLPYISIFNKTNDGFLFSNASSTLFSIDRPCKWNFVIKNLRAGIYWEKDSAINFIDFFWQNELGTHNIAGITGQYQFDIPKSAHDGASIIHLSGSISGGFLQKQKNINIAAAVIQVGYIYSPDGRQYKFALSYYVINPHANATTGILLQSY